MSETLKDMLQKIQLIQNFLIENGQITNDTVITAVANSKLYCTKIVLINFSLH